MIPNEIITTRWTVGNQHDNHAERKLAALTEGNSKLNTRMTQKLTSSQVLLSIVLCKKLCTTVFFSLPPIPFPSIFIAGYWKEGRLKLITLQSSISFTQAWENLHAGIPAICPDPDLEASYFAVWGEQRRPWGRSQGTYRDFVLKTTEDL